MFRGSFKGVVVMKTAVVTGKRETTGDGTLLLRSAPVVTATRGSAFGLDGTRASCSDTFQARRRRARVFRRSFAPRPSSAPMLRDALTAFLAANRVDDQVARRIVLCADEALINAVQHAPASPVDVVAGVRGDGLVLEVSDGGPGFDPARLDRDAVPELMGEHGRGLFLIRQLMDDLEILSDEHGTTLRMALHLHNVQCAA